MIEIHDPYEGCETGCTHDLARGVLIPDLQREGPYPDSSPLLGAGWLAIRITEASQRQATDSRIRT